MTQVHLQAFDILSGIQHTDGEGVSHIMEAVRLNPTLLQDLLEMLVHRSSYQVLDRKSVV